MKHKWLSLLIFGFLTIIVFLFFIIQIRPIEIPDKQIPDAEVGSLTEPSVTFVNPARGSETPKVTIVEFSDFQCSYCSSLADVMEVVLRTYPNEVRLVWKDMPNDSAHAQATNAAIAAHCADKQGAFWNYHDIIFERQTYLSEGQFSQIASDLNLDLNAFDECFNRRETLPIVQKDYQEGLALGISATPTIFINNERYVGAISLDELMLYVQQELDKK